MAGNGDLNVKYYNGKFDAYQRTYIIQSLDVEKLDTRYLYYFFEIYVQKLRELSIGGVIKYIKINNLTDPEIPLPSLADQKRIVRILDQADALRRKRKEAIGLLDAYVQSMFLEMFGDPVTNPKKAQKKALREVCNKITDGTHQPPPFSDSGIPFLFVRNIIQGYIDFETKKFITEKTYADLTRNVKPEKGDILYSTVGSYGMAVCVDTDRKFAFQRHIAHLKPDSKVMDSIFLAAQLNMQFVKAQADKAARGIAQKTVNLADIRKFEIAAPSLSEQKKYSDFYRRKEGIRDDMLAQSVELDNQFNSLMQSAFAEAL